MSELLLRSLRRLCRRPALTLTAVATLALAIGANSAIFSLLDSVALRPLPYPETDRLLLVGAAVPGLPALQEVSWPKFRALEEQARSASATAAWYAATFQLTDRERPVELAGLRVSRGFFATWGVAPELGRSFADEEQREGGPAVALLTWGFWRERFGGDPAIVGRAIELDGRTTTVVGVLPRSFGFPFQDARVVLPRPDEAPFLPRRILELGAGYLQVALRLQPGATGTAAQREIDAIGERYRRERPGQLDLTNPLAARPAVESLTGSTGRTLRLLLAAVALVLLVACADLANLRLADGLGRRQAFAIEVALGATPRHLARLLFAETLILAGAGGVLGAALAWGGLRLLVAWSPAALPRLAEASVSPAALAWTAGATLLATLVAGFAPLAQARRADPRRDLVEGGRGAAGPDGARAPLAQGLLVTGQVALALVLLSATALLVRSLERVRAVPLGFRPEGLAIVQVTLPSASYPGLDARRRFFDELLERTRALSGVEAAALVEYPPTAGAPHARLTRAAGAEFAPDAMPLVARLLASPGYFAAIGARFAEGRDFDPAAPPSAPPTAIVNRELARRLFPGRSPVGLSVRLRGADADVEIVGVVENVLQNPPEDGFEPMLYLAQRQAGEALFPPNFAQLVVRSSLPAERLAGALRATVRALDPGEPLPEITTARALLADATAARRLETRLYGGFAALALALAVLGVWAVVGQAVARRRRELGLRLALGATPARLVVRMLAAGGRWIAAGVALGGAGAWFAGRALAGQLYEVDATDPRHVAAAALALAFVALVGALVPALRAARTDPVATLRDA